MNMRTTKLFRKFSFLSRRKVYIPILAFLLVSAGAFYLFFLNKDSETTETDTVSYHSKLTGIKVSKEESEKPILAVMIENSVFARPQTGLDSAGIVFEAVTEGGITRFMALYQENPPELVGPIRSLRTHFLNWSMGFDASIAHVGGSAEALTLVEQRQARSMSQLKYPDPYFRSTDRDPPHNVYSKPSDLAKLQNDLGHTSPDFSEFKWEESISPENITAKEISVDFSGPDYASTFKYDKQSNTYIRYLAGQPQIDTITNKPISVKNVVIIKTKGLSAGVEAIGSGEALVFKNGSVIKGTWELPDFNQRLLLSDVSGNEISLVRGDIWVMAPSNDRTVIYK